MLETGIALIKQISIFAMVAEIEFSQHQLFGIWYLQQKSSLIIQLMCYMKYPHPVLCYLVVATIVVVRVP
jgi:hypothetical protein